MWTSTALMLGAALFALNVSADDLKAELLGYEKSVWEGWGRKSAAPFLEHSADDYTEIVADGRFTGRDAVAKRLVDHDCVLNGFELDEAELQQLTPDVVVLSYLARQNTVCGGTTEPAGLWASAIYVRRGGEWRNTNYQSTAVK